MPALAQFDEVHVVSDLHLGGTNGYQVFDQTETFARFVNHLTLIPPNQRIALIINGDFVDFLAEPSPTYFDLEQASAKLSRICSDGNFAGVWDSLRSFVATKNRHLIIVLGNHDLELALPWMREQLRRELTNGDEAAMARTTLAFSEDGFRCSIGNTNIFCAHGNEVDPWNVTDWGTLESMGRAGSHQGWIPNAGTRLVIDVMNGIKHQYAFVNLLKPETEAVLPVLIALDPRLIVKIADALSSGARFVRDSILMKLDLLGDQVLSVGPEGCTKFDRASALRHMLGATFRGGLTSASQVDQDFLLDRTEELLAKGVTPIQLLNPEAGRELLGIASAIQNLILHRGKAEILREALEKLKQDRSFDIKSADHTCRSISHTPIGSASDIIICGHTHLERSVQLQGHGRCYFNSGTWTCQMRLGEDVLSDKEKFASFFELVERSRNVALLASADGFVERRPTVVSVWTKNSNVHAELRRVSLAGARVLEPVAGSHFVRG